MSNQAFTTTPKGTKLPLLNLKGKQYLMGAYRLVWLNEEHPNFTIETDLRLVTDEQTICSATVTLLNQDGSILRKATATKRETKKDFPDHTEKAESSAIFRALAMLGFGTQFATVEFDEGERIADSPLDVKPREEKKAVVAVSNVQTEVAPPKPAGGFGVKKAPVAVKEDDGGWQ